MRILRLEDESKAIEGIKGLKSELKAIITALAESHQNQTVIGQISEAYENEKEALIEDLNDGLAVIKELSAAPTGDARLVLLSAYGDLSNDEKRSYIACADIIRRINGEPVQSRSGRKSLAEIFDDEARERPDFAQVPSTVAPSAQSGPCAYD